MLAVLDIDPQQHEVIRLPITDALQREVRHRRVITYRHKWHQNWLVAIQSPNGKSMLEVDFLNLEDPRSKDCSREHFWKLVRSMTSWTQPGEIKEKQRCAAKAHLQERQDEDDELHDSVAGMYRRITRDFGHVAAERYAMNVGFTFSRGLRG